MGGEEFEALKVVKMWMMNRRRRLGRVNKSKTD